MPFENFYKSEDEWKAERWKALNLLCGLVLWLFLWLALSSLYYLIQQLFFAPNFNETAAPTASERLRHVNELCANLPKPEKFFFEKRDEPKYFVDSTSIIYRYSSDRSPEEIMPAFLIWFNANGWQSIVSDATMFKKGKQTVSIRVLKPFDVVTGYEIQCYESDY